MEVLNILDVNTVESTSVLFLLGPGDYTEEDDDSVEIVMTAESWLNFAAVDGAHVRENR